MRNFKQFVQACAGMCRVLVQGKSRVFIGLCRVCKHNARTRARKIFYLSNIKIFSRACRDTPAHPAHACTTRVNACVQTCAYACTCLHTLAHTLFI